MIPKSEAGFSEKIMLRLGVAKVARRGAFGKG
jgi:hypothetical protein